MYTTCVIWLAFVPLFFATANHVALRITSMSVTISLSAFVTVACLFTPKVSQGAFSCHLTFLAGHYKLNNSAPGTPVNLPKKHRIFFFKAHSKNKLFEQL